MNINDILAEGLRDPRDNPCWKGYHPVGTKQKDGRTVPNCVPNANEGVAEGSLNENADVLAGLTDILKIAASRQPPQNPRYFAQQVKDVALQLKDNPATQKWASYFDGVVRWADVIANGTEQYSSGFANEVHNVLGPATRAYQDALLNKQGVAEDFHGEYDDEAGIAHTNLVTIARAAQGLLDTIDQHENLPEWVQEKIARVEGMLVKAWDYLKSQEAQGIDPRIAEMYQDLNESWQHISHRVELNNEFNLIENFVNGLAARYEVSTDYVWEDLESLTDDELYVFAVTSEPVMESQSVAEYGDTAKGQKMLTKVQKRAVDRMIKADDKRDAKAAKKNQDTANRAWDRMTDKDLEEDWQKVNKKDKTDGMSKKAVNAYRRENPGSKLKTAVTTKPGKLKKGSKASKRRKSYCSRSKGQMDMHNISCAKTPDKAICKARRRWNC